MSSQLRTIPDWQVPSAATVAAAVAIPALWLSPPFLVGITLAIANRLMSAGTESLIELCLLWGVAGAIFVPLVALIAARLGGNSDAITASSILVSCIAYICLSFGAIWGIFIVDEILNPTGWAGD